jgi:hypothetical protein
VSVASDRISAMRDYLRQFPQWERTLTTALLKPVILAGESIYLGDRLRQVPPPLGVIASE